METQTAPLFNNPHGTLTLQYMNGAHAQNGNQNQIVAWTGLDDKCYNIRPSLWSKVKGPRIRVIIAVLIALLRNKCNVIK